MNDDLTDYFSRPINSRSASNFLRELSPRGRQCHDTSVDDTEIRFQLPPKKLKLEDSPGAKPFPKFESHFDLIQAKSESAKLQTKINALERELVELKTRFDKEKDTLLRQNNALEYRLTSIERELSAMTEKELNSKNELEKLSKSKEVEKLALNEKLRQMKERNMQIESEFKQKDEESNSRVQTTWMELQKEKSLALELHNLSERLGEELSLQKSRNAKLSDELKNCYERLAQVSKKSDEQAIMIKQWREENEIATAMRLDVAELKSLRQENASLKKENQRYKNLSENTTLLREQKVSLEDNVEKLKRTVEKYMDENNELKIVVAKNQSPISSQRSFHDIDYLTKQCVEFKFELQNKEEKINSMEILLIEYQQKIVALEEIQQKKEETLFYSMNATTLPKTTCEEIGSGVETEIPVQMHENLANSDSDLLKEENAKLLTMLNEKTEEIQFLMQKFGLIPDYDPAETKVMHFCANPLDEAHSRHANLVENLQEENAALKLRVEELKKFRPTVSSESNMMVVDDDVTSNVYRKLEEQKSEKIIEDLQAKIEKLTEQRDRAPKICQELAAQFREMSQELTGYQMKMKENGRWKVQSIFETQEPERTFIFSKSPDGTVDLMANEYASSWQDFVDMYLKTDHSFPAFLAAVTLQLFSKKQNESSSVADNTSSIGSSIVRI